MKTEATIKIILVSVSECICDGCVLNGFEDCDEIVVKYDLQPCDGSNRYEIKES